MPLNKDPVQVCLPYQRQLENPRLEYFVSERSCREERFHSRFGFSQLLLAFILEPSGRGIPEKSNFGLAGLLFAVLALRFFANRFLLRHHFSLNVSKLLDALRTPGGVYQVEVRTVMKGFEYA